MACGTGLSVDMSDNISDYGELFVANSAFTNGTGDGILLKRVGGVKFSNVKCQSNAGWGLHIEGISTTSLKSSATVQGVYGSTLTLEDNTLGDMYITSLSAFPGDYPSRIAIAPFHWNSAGGVWLEKCQDVTLLANAVHNSKTLRQDVGATGVITSGNFVRSGSGTSYFDFYVPTSGTNSDKTVFRVGSSLVLIDAANPTGKTL